MSKLNEKVIQKITNSILQAKEIIFAITSIVVVLLNMWLSSQLYPLDERISKNANAIESFEEQLQSSYVQSEMQRTDLNKKLDYITGRVDSIYDRHYTP